MKTLFVVLMVLSVSCTADTLIGTAMLKYLNTPDYNPGGCDEVPLADGEECVELGYWQRYELAEFIGINGQNLGTQIAVMEAHSKRGGMWLLVVEELSPEEATKFDAKYKVVDGSEIYQGACLQRRVQDYIPDLYGRELKSEEGESCYNVFELQINNEER